MKAKLAPLKNKYYGTCIDLQVSKYETTGIEIWCSHENIPSTRECAQYKITQQQWINNAPIKTQGGTYPAKEILEICDSHFESEFTFQLAQHILKSLESFNYESPLKTKEA